MSSYQTEIRSASNIIIADEPKSKGGDDAGLSPMELLAASLGSCTAITVRMYAEHKGWELDDIQVEVKFEQDLEKNESRIFREVKFTGNLDDEQRERLLKVANSCPMHKALTHPISIETEMKA